MKNPANIHNPDTLEKEIYRLKLDTKKMEETLDDNFEHLRYNYASLFMNSFFHKRQHPEEKNSFFDSSFKKDAFQAAVNKVTDHLANKVTEGMDNLIDKVFHKKK